MALGHASRIGPYEIVARIGEGGMGEVYRARDTKLGRSVAIKVLPESLASDAGRIERFEREAKTLAALNHHNIAAIYGLEGSEQATALVMELVEGPTLADRLAQGALPVDEALAVARQIADALEAAHEQGIVHRDLKPANIKIRPDGTVKVLDFGLAKAMEPVGTREIAQTNSPTIVPLATQAGLILGTAAYMSPEQARGRIVDKRTDIWAFGCVLYEMLTARPAFGGETVSDIISAVLTREPDWASLPASTQGGIRQLLRRCLDKDVRRRVHDIADARLELEDVLSAPPASSTDVQPRPPRNTIWWTVAALVASALTGLVVWSVKPRDGGQASPDVARLLIASPEPVPASSESPLAFSPDGRRIVYVAGRDGQQRMYVRDIDSFESRAIAGTDGGDSPAVSPDGRWLAFVADHAIKKVPLDGGSATVLAAFNDGRGLSWESNDALVFNQGRASGVWRVPATGGTPEAVTKIQQGENEHNFPFLLPGGKGLLFSASVGVSSAHQVYAQSLETGQRHLIAAGVWASYLPLGYLLYVQSNTLYAVPFDLARLEVTGPPVAVLQGVAQNSFNSALLSVSPTGSLAYIQATQQGHHDALVWVDLHGAEQATMLSGGAYTQPHLSPDGHRVLVTLEPGGDQPAGSAGDIWMYDLTRDTSSQLTFDGRSVFPAWTPDGGHFAFSSGRTGPYNIYLKAIDGTAVADQFFSGNDGVNYPMSWSPNGRLLTFVTANSTTANDIWVIDRREPGKARAILNTRFREGAPAFSPDGRWIAYVSDRSTRPEVYMRPVSGAGEELAVSSDGGNEPMWARDTWQLFYRQGDTMMVVDVKPGAVPVLSKPRPVFTGRYKRSASFFPNFDVAPDGKHLLMVKSLDEAQPPTQINVVINWGEELERLMSRK